MKISIVPEMINSDGIQLFDENGIDVELCPRSLFRLNFQPLKPFILVDNFEKDAHKDIEIKRADIASLEKLGYRLVSIKPDNSNRWYRGQRIIYMLENKNRPIPRSIVMTKVPHDHVIEHDVVGKRLRIKGKNAGYPHIRSEMVSRWVDL